MGSKVFERKNRVYNLKYSDDISKICKPYKIVSNIAWIVVVIALVEPRVLLPTFLLSLLMFLSKKMKVSWRVSTFLEKVRNGRVDEGKKILSKLQGDIEDPIYKELKGWKTDIRGIKEYDSLPQEAKDYVQFIEKELGVKVSMVSNGPKRDEVLFR